MADLVSEKCENCGESLAYTYWERRGKNYCRNCIMKLFDFHAISPFDHFLADEQQLHFPVKQKLRPIPNRQPLPKPRRCET